MKSCLFIVYKTMWWISSHFSANRNSKLKNAELSILAGEDLTPKNPLERERRLKIQRRKQQRWMETAVTNSGTERTSLNEFQMLKFLKSKWKQFWIISLINIWANIAVTKHVLLADEFVPYRPRLLGFHSLHVNAMKCFYVGVSLSKLQSFFWKISLDSCLIRPEGFNNKNSMCVFHVCVLRGLVVKLSPGAPKGPSSNLDSTFLSSLLFFYVSF